MTAPVMTAPPYEVEVITVMTWVDMTGAGAVSRGKSGDHNREVMTMTDMTGSVMVGMATVFCLFVDNGTSALFRLLVPSTVCNRFTVPTNV